MKIIKLILIITFLISLLVPVNVLANGHLEANIKLFPLCYALKTDTIEIEAEFPVIKGIKNQAAGEDFNREIRDKVLDFTEELKNQSVEFMKDIEEGKLERPFFKYQAMVVYDVKNRDDILSLLFSFYQYTGGAHGLTTVESYNLDSETGENLKLQDYLDRTTLDLQQVKETIIKKIEENQDDYFPGAVEFIRDEEEFDYYLEDDNLVIYFQQYDIAPYAAGNPEFRIPV